MPAFLQLSATTILNLDAVTVLRQGTDGRWQAWLSDPSTPLALSDDEHVVLALYLRNHTARTIYNAWREAQRQPQEPHDA